MAVRKKTSNSSSKSSSSRKTKKVSVAKPEATTASTLSTSSTLSTFSTFSPVSLQNPKMIKKIVIFLAILLVILLAYFKKEWFVAATVNGSPITTIEVFSRMNQDFKGQIVQQMTDEKLIMDEAKKNNALPSSSDINAKMLEIEKRVGGAEALSGLLAQQGQTRASVERQIKLQLAMEKLYSSSATVSADEVSKYISQNGALLTATDSAGRQAEATEALRQQKLSQILADKFQELKTNAKINIF